MKPMKLILPILMLLVLSITAACNGGPTSETRDSISPPAGLSYSDPAVVYALGSAIPPNQPSSSGGAITQYSVSPALPTGLALDPVTGIISGTPTAIAHATIYTVTGRNAAGSAAARVQIEVKDHAIAPDSIAYPDNPAVYTSGVAIHPNVPVVSGGAITGFAVSPALPAGLALNAQTGAISGTPTAVTPAADYTVTGSNSAGRVSTVVNIESSKRARAADGFELRRPRCGLPERTAHCGEHAACNRWRRRCVYSHARVTRRAVHRCGHRHHQRAADSRAAAHRLYGHR
ncbi:hypothetical protein BDAG_04766 [Burkholderia dolosa AU0158]|nr:hypothetical protein BDAG_04766 [Burkholderia dolosa AU0158]